MGRRRAATVIATVATVATVTLTAACSAPTVRRDGASAAPPLHAFGTYRTLEGDTVVEVTFTGFPDESGPCEADYHAVASETAERVYVQVQILREPAPQARTLCARLLRPRTVSVSLRSPMDGRAVVDSATGGLMVAQR